MYQCTYCGYCSEELDDFEEDFKFHTGFWCPWCDGFTYFDKNIEKHSFKLMLETKGRERRTDSKSIVFRTQVSPLRWPGGKSRMVKQIFERCNPEKLVNFAEPYAGGASVGLALLLAGQIENLHLNDLDKGVYSLFQIIKECPEQLIYKINSFVPTKEAYQKAQKIVLGGYKDTSLEDAAWNLLVVNRLAFSGISKANCMSNPSARWNADTLVQRIRRIHSIAERIHVSCMDACDFIEEMYWKDRTTIFVDPPYVGKGKALYTEYYLKEDHERLAFLLDELHKGMPGADILLTYDENDFIRSLYQFPSEEVIRRNYSIAN